MSNPKIAPSSKGLFPQARFAKLPGAATGYMEKPRDFEASLRAFPDVLG